MKKTLIIIGVVIVTIFICSKLANSGNGTSSTSSYSNKDTWEYKLAMLNAGTPVKNDDITVRRFRNILDNMTALFPEENDQGISDGIVTVRNLLEKGGISESLLNIAESLNKIFIENKAGVKFNELSAAYVTLRLKGNSSSETVQGLQSMFNTLGAR
jgi:hypothetical protein